MTTADIFRRPTRRTSRLLASLAPLSALALIAACSDSVASEARPGISYAPAVSVGEGTVRTYVVSDARGTPTSLGVELSESALRGLPSTPLMLHLPFPEEAGETQYTFMMFDWNPAGHEPEHVYTIPHFDFHFYMGEEAEVLKIPGGPDPVLPDARFVPADYIAPGNEAVPGMGVHWVDRTAGELNGRTFDQTFIYGFTGGKLLFVEPMITKAFLESNTSFTTELKVPAAVQRPGFYPKRYSIRHDAAAKVYRISIDELTRQQ